MKNKIEKIAFIIIFPMYFVTFLPWWFIRKLTWDDFIEDVGKVWKR